jgi:DNA-binding NtrC family response regulator
MSRGPGPIHRVNADGMQKYSVLVVDDDRALLETTVALLQPPHDVVATTSPSKALDLLSNQTFHVVVSDWMMPVVDGVEFLQRVTRLDYPVACLLVSVHLEELPDAVDYEQRKMFLTLAKPFTREQVLARIDKLGRLAVMKQSVRGIKGKT